MLEFRFRKAEHEDYGYDGWILEGAPNAYVPLMGMGVAHDVLEHKPDDKGTIEDELLALGASLFIRGEGGYWSRMGNVHPPGVHVGSDIGYDLAFKYEGLENGIEPPGRTRHLDGYVEDWIEEAVTFARKRIKEELSESEGYGPQYTRAQIDAYLRRVPGWLRKGYHAAVKRWRGHSAYTVCVLFENIANKSDALLKSCDPDYCPLVIRLDVKECKALVFLDESELG